MFYFTCNHSLIHITVDVPTFSVLLRVLYKPNSTTFPVSAVMRLWWFAGDTLCVLTYWVTKSTREHIDRPGQTASGKAGHKQQDDPMKPSWTFPSTVAGDLLKLTVPQRRRRGCQRRQSCQLIRTYDAETSHRTATNLPPTVTRSETWFWRDRVSFWQVMSTIYWWQPP